MNDINELRRLAQAAKDGCKSAEWAHEFREGRFSEGRIFSGDEMIIIICGGNFGCWRDADDDGASQFKALGDFVAAANPATITSLLDRLEAAEKERNELRAKVDAMERQEPVMWVNSSNIDSSSINKERGGHGDQHTCSEKQTTYHNTPLYSLPGAKGG